MKNHAKLIIFMIIAMLVAGISGCGPTATTEPTLPPQPTAVPPTAVPPTATPVPQPVTLRYANWNLGTEEENNIQRQLIAAYTAAHPLVTVEIVDMSGEGGWDAVLTGYAAKGELPDVFMANNTPLYVKNGWLADLTAITSTDADWATVPQALKDDMTYNGKLMGMPAAYFIMGYWVNADLYEAANLDAPVYGTSVDDFWTVAKALTNIPQGILGLDEQYAFEGWIPGTQDAKLKWFSFDGTKMNYNSDAFKAAVTKTQEMIPYTWQGLTDEQKANFTSVGPWELYLKQEVGVRWDASWAMGDFVKNATFTWDFVGIPGGNQALVFDPIVVSQTSPNLEEAYNFAKWMTFSSEAYALEAQLNKAAGTAPKFPVSLDAASVALFKTFVDKPGVNAALANLDNSLTESLAKVIPGYIQARWEGKPGIDIGDNKDVTIGWMLDNAPSGSFKFEDYSANLEAFANQLMADAQAGMPK